MTPGGELPARFVIHTVGPIYGRHGGREAELLERCYRNALSLGREEGLKTVAFPAISTGVYGYPAREAARVVSRTLADELASDETFAEIRLVFFDRGHADTFVSAARFLTST